MGNNLFMIITGQQTVKSQFWSHPTPVTHGQSAFLFSLRSLNSNLLMFTCVTGQLYFQSDFQASAVLLTTMRNILRLQEDPSIQSGNKDIIDEFWMSITPQCLGSVVGTGISTKKKQHKDWCVCSLTAHKQTRSSKNKHRPRTVAAPPYRFMWLSNHHLTIFLLSMEVAFRQRDHLCLRKHSGREHSDYLSTCSTILKRPDTTSI